MTALLVAVAGVGLFTVGRRALDPYDGQTRMSPRALPADGSLPAGFYATPTDGSLLDVATIETVVDAAWSAREYAYLEGDAEVFRRISTGPSLAATGYCRFCAAGSFEGADGVLHSYAAPAPDGYPVWFLAEVRSTSLIDPGSIFLVMAREGPDAPWLIEYSAMGPFREAQLPVPDGRSLALSEPATSTGDRTLGAEVRLLNEYANSGVVAPELKSSWQYHEELLPAARRLKVDLGAAGGGYLVGWWPTGPSRRLVLPDGSTMACLTLRGTGVRWLPPGARSEHMSRPGRTLPELPDGSYRVVVTTSARTACYWDSARSRKSWKVGADGGVFVTIGLPADP